MRTRAGFSLVEVTLAIGVVAFALVAILALVPVGINSSKNAVEGTHTSLIGEDVHARVTNSLTSATFAGGDVQLPPWFYNREGVYVDVIANGYSTAIYRAQATIHSNWNSLPPNVDTTLLRPVTIVLGWPLDPNTHASLGNNAASFTFYVRRP